jgi:hypothetical protein
MDFLEFVCVMTVILVSGGLIFVWMSTKTALISQDLAEKRRISAERSKAAKARYEQDNDEIAPWASELLSTLGVSPEVLFEDEMPAELKAFMPAIKGFIQGGGIQKILAGAQGPPADDRASI